MNQPAEFLLKTVGFLRFRKALRDDWRSLLVTRPTRDGIHSGLTPFKRGAIVAVGELPAQRWALRRNFARGQSAQPSSRVSSHKMVLVGSCEFRSDSRRQVMTSERIALAGRDLSKPTSRRLCREAQQEVRRRATLLPTSSNWTRLNQPRLEICNPLNRHFGPKTTESKPGR